MFSLMEKFSFGEKKNTCFQKSESSPFNYITLASCIEFPSNYLERTDWTRR